MVAPRGRPFYIVTKAQLITDLKKLIGPGIEVDDASLLVWLNGSYMRMVDAIQDADPDFFTKAATADTEASRQEYELPDDFDHPLMVTINYNGVVARARPMTAITDVAIHGGADTSEGRTVSEPSYYIVGNHIGFLPIPDANGSENIKLWYVYTPSELSADSDEPAFPAKYHHILKYWAYADYLDQDDEHVAAENMRRRFDQMVERMTEKLVSSLDQPRSVQITTGTDLYYDDYDYS